MGRNQERLGREVRAIGPTADLMICLPIWL